MDIEGWDPRKLDYGSSKFNSYTGGPGQMVQTREQKDVITLFVEHIPTAITKEGLRNMFSDAGTVKRVAFPPAQLGRDTAYGFVEFGTVREAETAIQLLHNKDMGRGNRLVVKIAESKKNRDDRLQIRKEEEEFIKTLHCGKTDEGDYEQHVSDYEAENAMSNPLQPRYISNNTEKSAEGVSSGRNSLNSSGGASSCNALSDKVGSEKHSLDGRRMRSPLSKMSCGSSSSDADTFALLPCTVCQKPTSSRCPLCKTHYCTVKCQSQDWPRHREGCVGRKKKSSETTKPPAETATNAALLCKNSELCIADNSDDDGFVLDCPSANDLVPVKELLYQGDLASLVTEEASSGRFSSHPLPSDQSPQMNYEKPDKPTSEDNSLMAATQSKSLPLVKTSSRKTPPFSPLESEAILQPFKGVSSSSAFLTSPKPSAMCSSLSLADGALHTSKHKTLLNLELGLASPGLTCSGIDVLAEDCFVPVNLIHSQFDLIKKPLLSLPLTSFPPPEFQAIITFYFSPTHFNVIIPSAEVKQAIQLIRSIGTTLQPGNLLASQLSQGSKCGYKDKQGDFLRVTVSKVCSPEKVMLHRYDFGGDFSVPVWELSCLPEELVFIPCLTHRCCLQDRFISQHGKANQSIAFRVLKELVNGEPVTILNLSPGLNPNISLLLCSIKNKVGTVNLSNALLSSPYVTCFALQARETGNLTSPSLKLSCAASKIPHHHVRPGTTVIILPTVVVNPSIIWAQVVHSNFSVMEEMHEDLNACYPPRDISSTPYMPVVGEICVAKYSQDQKYYRAEVLCVNHSGTVDIRFTETGRTENVTTNQLYHILPVFLTMPRQARKFSMCGVAPIQSSWTNNAIAFLKDKILNRKVTVKVVTAISNELVSEIFDPDLDNQILNNSLILLSHAQACHTDPSLKCSSKTNLRGVSVLTTPPDSPFKETVLKSPPFSPLKNPQAQKLSNVLDGTGKCSQPSAGFQGSPKSGFIALKESTNSQLQNTSPKLMLSAGDCVNVNLSHVIGLERFCVQLMTPGNLAKVQVMLQKIENVVLVPLPPEQYQKGKLCLCLYPEDNHVHRAMIKSYTNNFVVVIFVDYGNIFSTSDHIYQVTEELFDLPFQAIMCSLYQVRNPAGTKKEWDPVALNFFKDMLESGQPKIKVVEVVGALHVVDMNVSSAEGVVDVLKALCEAGYVMDRRQYRERHSSTRKISTPDKHQDRRKDVVGPYTSNKYASDTQRTLGAGKTEPPNKNNAASLSTSCIQMSFPSVSKMKKLSFPQTKKPFSVVVCEVVTIQEIYVQVVTEDSASAISKVSEALGSSLSNLLVSPSSFPPVGSLCCAKFSQDKMWYRCQVESICGDMISVFFVDFGNRDSVVLSDVALCPALCTSVPTVAIKCGLAGLSSMVVQGDKAVEFLKDHTADCIVSVKVVSEAESIPQVLMTSNDLDLIKEMTKQGIIVLSKTEMMYPLVATLDTMQLPTRDGMLKVLMTEVTSPSEMYLQIATGEVGKLLIRIGKGINAYFKSHPPQSLSSFPKVGSLCCAKFDADKLWYRVEILQIIENSCIVFFVDYGDKKTVSLSDIAVCPSEFSSQPLLAIRCGLGGLPSSSIVSEDKVTQYLHQYTVDAILSAKVVGRDDGAPLLELHNKGMDLLEEMFKLGLVNPVVPKHSLPLVQDMVCCALPNSGAFQVMVTEVVNSMEFYIQVATTEIGAMLNKISEGINSEMHPLQPLSSSPAVGYLYCAKFSVDSQWYRVELLQLKEKSCLVFFVDFGNKDEVSLSDMATCPPEFSSLPIATVKCGLRGLPPKLALSDKIKVHLQKYLSNSLVSASVVSVTDNGPLLEIQKDGKNLLDDMSDLGLLELPITKISPPLVKDMSLIPFPISGTFQVMVTEVVNSMEYYTQVATTEVVAMLNKITEGINSEMHPLQPLSSSPAVGSLCCAKFSVDNQWYRVEVLQLKEKCCLVMFVDFGNKDEVSLSDMATCPPEFSSLPLVAVKCGLSGLPPKLALSDEIKVHLQKYLSNSLVSASVVSVTDDGPLLEIQKDGKNLLGDMSDLGLLELPITKISLPLVKDMSLIPFPISVSGTFQVMVTEVVNSMEYYTQVATTEVVAMLNKITEGINSEMHPLQPLSSSPAVGSLCCAKFSVDNQWYRVEVLQLKEKCCLVLFVDFGNKDEVPLSDMATCPPEFSSLPLVAVKCGLSGLPPKLALSDKINVHIHRCLSNSLVSARVVSVTDNGPLLEIQKDGKNLLDDMFDLGLLELPITKISLPLVKDMSRSPFPNSETFQVMVTEVISPVEFYTQVATTEVVAMLNKITEGINSEVRALQPLSSSPAVGSLCCAKFSADMQWYRVEVLQVREKSFLVLFVDFGNKDEVPLSDMAICPSEYSSLPLVAINCSLSGLPFGINLTVEAKNLFQRLSANSLVSAKMVGETNGIPQLELCNSEICLLDEVLKHNLVTEPSASEPSASEPSASLLPPLIASMNKMILPSSSAVDAMVIEIVSLGEIYIQMATQEVALLLTELLDSLNQYFDSHSSSFFSLPPVGSLCCAKFSQDLMWYRAELLTIEGDDKCTVRFIDYGNKVTLSLSTLAACPSQFALLPIIAVCCGLDGISSSSVVSVDLASHYLKEFTFDVVVSINVISSIDGIPQVKLSIKDRDIVTVMAEEGLISTPHPSADLKMLPFPPSECVPCLMYEVVNLSEFYIHVNNKERTTVLDKINKAIESLFIGCPPKPLVIAPSVGDLCIAKFSEDNTWYRVRVNAVSGKACEVLYLDYRNIETVNLSNMLTCPAQIASLPQIAIKCGLAGFQSDYIASAEKVSVFRKLTSNNCVLSATYFCDAGGVPQIELVKDGKSLLSLLGLSLSSFPMVVDMKKLQFPSSSEPIQLLVCGLNSPHDMYVQVNNECTILSLKAITMVLEKFFTKHEPLSSLPPIGSLCCAKFAQDNTWYRARIDDISGDCCQVFFIDYGNSEEVHLTQVAVCPPDIMELPVVAIRCSLFGVCNLSPPQSICPPSALKILKQLMFGHLLNASVVTNIRGECPVVQLAEISDGTLISVKFQEMYRSSGSSLCKCQVTELNDPGSLYFQYIHTDNANNLDLLNKLQDVYACSSDYKNFTPAVGSFCCAQFRGDLCWYRCKVKSITKDTIGLYYIDFGSVESLPSNKVYSLDKEFTALPPLAVHCKINGIRPKQAEGWGKDVVDKLIDLCDKKFLFVSVVGSEGDLVTVDLFQDKDSQCSIADSLVASGHVIYT